ncbi:MAG: hypothetical protein RIC55_01980 [Pirellulaceae bacterium]
MKNCLMSFLLCSVTALLCCGCSSKTEVSEIPVSVSVNGLQEIAQAYQRSSLITSGPYAIQLGDKALLCITETNIRQGGSFSSNSRFYEYVDGNLVQVPVKEADPDSNE